VSYGQFSLITCMLDLRERSAVTVSILLPVHIEQDRRVLILRNK